MSDYKVGYKKPPKAYQWRPGQSGNYKGRPKGSRNKRSLLQELLSGLAKSDMAKLRRQYRG